MNTRRPWFALLGACALAAPAPAGDGPPWPLVQELVAGDAGGHLGIDVALSGDTALLAANVAPGAPGYYGAAYVYEYDGSAWVEEPKLLPSAPTFGDWFGFRVALDGDLAAVSAFRDKTIGNDAGAVYVYRRVGGAWFERAKLLPDPPATGDEFGRSIAVSGERVVVGARNDDDAGADEGAVYVFRELAGSWGLEQKLPWPGGGPGYGSSFGEAVALDGDTLAATHTGVGPPAYVFRFESGAWTLEQALTTLEAPQPTAFSVDVDGDTVVFGAPNYQYGPGRAWVFARSGGSWTQQGYLRPLDGTPGDWFGKWVAASGDRAAVGAFLEESPELDAGAVYVFERLGARWIEERHLPNPSGEPNDRFGAAVDLEGGRLLVGAYNVCQPGGCGGAGYLFEAEPYLGIPYCFGDGAGTPCPCGNESTPLAGLGCANSQGGGARLDAFGSTSVAADDLVCRGLALVPGHAALLFAGTEALNGGNGLSFGDGLRCAATGVVRLGIEFPVAPAGCATWGPGLAALGGWSAGDTRFLQVWYRDAVGGPCGSTFNLSNALELTLAP